jgi:chromosome segregation ATPase
VHERSIKNEKIDNKVEKKRFVKIDLQKTQSDDSLNNSRHHNMSELEKRLKAYDDADKKIRDETGTGDINEICQKYSNLKETKEKLEDEMKALEVLFKKLKQIKDDLVKELTKLKFQGDITVSSKQIEQEESMTDKALKGCDESRGKLKNMDKLLNDMSAGVDTIITLIKHRRVTNY